MSPLEAAIVVVLLGLLGGVGIAVASFVWLSAKATKPAPRNRRASVPPVLPPVERITPLPAMVFSPSPAPTARQRPSSPSPPAPPPPPAGPAATSSSADLLIYPSSERTPTAASERRLPAPPRVPSMKRPSVPPPVPAPTPWVRGHEPAGRFGSRSPLPLFRPPSAAEVAGRTPLDALPPISRAAPPPPLDADRTRKMPRRPS